MKYKKANSQGENYYFPFPFGIKFHSNRLINKTNLQEHAILITYNIILEMITCVCVCVCVWGGGV